MIGTMKSKAGSNCQAFPAPTLFAIGAVLVAACSDTRKPDAPRPPVGRPLAIKAQLANGDPCRLVTPAEVAKVAGRPTRGVPVRVSSAESVTPSSSGSGCMYELQPEAGQEPGMLAIEVKVDGAAEMEQGLGAGVGGMFRGSEAKDSVWDWVSGLPAGLFAGRRGHVGILIAINAASLSPLGVEPLGALALGRVSDLPFVEDSADLEAVGSGSDPCALITRAEAEQQLGPLVVEPFRSRQSTPFAYGAGPSCTYYTSGHRALVVTPTYSDAKMQFALLTGAAGMVNRLTGDDRETATMGSWDGRGNGVGGTIYFLKGDKMLELKYRTSSTDEKGANRLANLAFGRL